MTFEVTIPVLNEEACLEKQVLLLRDFLRQNFPANGLWKIVIADNGSTDRTPEIAESLCRNFEEIKLVKVPKRGVGLALKISWTQSEADIVGYMDLDLATDLAHFKTVMDVLVRQNYDLVYATRLHRDSVVIGRSLKREITSRVFNLILKIYLGVRFSDGMCGFKFLKKQHLQKLMAAGAVSDGWFFSTELLTTAEWGGLKIFELPVKWTDDAENSKVKIIPLALEYLRAMRVLKKRKPQNRHGKI